MANTALSIVPDIPKKSQPKKKITVATKKPKNGTTIKPKSPIYTALHEFFQHHKTAVIALYVLGIVKGAFFPVCAFVTSHNIVWQWSFATVFQFALTVFCLLFSVPTALQFGKVAFNGYKGVGFAIGLELAMLAGSTKIGYFAAGILTVINILAAFYNMRSGKQFTDLVEHV
jgi:hypothetical protein